MPFKPSKFNHGRRPLATGAPRTSDTSTTPMPKPGQAAADGVAKVATKAPTNAVPAGTDPTIPSEKLPEAVKPSDSKGHDPVVYHGSPEHEASAAKTMAKPRPSGE